ncbi:hypothetical protein BB559_003664 [Furculomyces boomerangus]|uniref:DNA polymerase epsilon subunit n=2 Tax=Furculomyces boomerangus TaxID=61424 RepID=A0A2T9YJT7_9FUNG|nr:hypothetical protein BB559_003664 [Furculomyces boomerangus]
MSTQEEWSQNTNTQKNGNRKNNTDTSSSFMTDSIRTDERKLFKVISAYDSPQLWYDPKNGAFSYPDSIPKSMDYSAPLGVQDSSEKPQKDVLETKNLGLVASPQTKIELFRQRYDVIRQRIQRNDAHLRETPMGNTWNGKILIDSVSSLKGREGQEFAIFGMISQLEEGVYYVEDKDGSIKLNFSNTNLENEEDIGIITENSFVIVEGILNDDTFIVQSLMQPPPETQAKSKYAFQGIDFFGGPKLPYDQATLKAIEGLDDNGAIVFLSDIWLDRQQVLDSLKKLFSGFSSSRLPLAFVLMGDFSSIPYLPGSNSISKYQENMSKLVSIITEFPDITKQCHFVIVPGPNDPWGMGALPYPPLPKFLTDRFKSRIPRSNFTTNPCRIRFCTQEIVVFRDDLIKKMRRNSVLWPKGVDNLFETKVVKTLINQSHLSPLPIRVRPVFWGYDHALRIYPSPDLIVLADKFESYNVFYNETLAINPGSFSTNGFKFHVYLPATKTFQIR